MLTTAGTYTDTIPGAGSNGCDSLVILRLTVANPASIQTATACLGTGYLWNGVTYTVSGNYIDTTLRGASVAGCDSTVTLRLTITTKRAPLAHDTLCSGGSLVIGTTQVTGSGIYIDTVVLASGCDSLIYHRVYVDTVPQAMITPSGTTLTGTPSTGYTDQWMLGGAAIPGAIQSSYTTTGSGSYSYMITDSLGCTSTSSVYTILGIGSVSESLNTRIYPNPNNGSFVLETSNAVGYEAVIYDVLGNVIAQKTISKDKMPIQLSSAEGIYILTIRDINGTISTSRFTVSK
jgi:hypothetical protein